MQNDSSEAKPLPGLRRPLIRYGLLLISSMAIIALLWRALGGPELPAIHFMPHGMCYMWNPFVLTLHVSSDLLIGCSYVAISSTLTYLVHRARRDIPFTWLFIAFGLFIVACGATHFLEVWTVWNPTYWLSGQVKAITAVASVATALVLPQQVPKVLGLITTQKIAEEQRIQLERANQELAQIRAELERRVEERTQEFMQANLLLQGEIVERKRIEQERTALLAREQEARQAAETANQMKDEFLAVVSHELRTPLNSILGWSKLLQGRKLDNEAATKSLEIIVRSAKSQSQLIDDILDVSRIITGRMRLYYQTVDFMFLIETTVEGFRPAAEGKGIRLKLDLGTDRIKTLGDTERLRQVIWNLVSNAIKFTDKGGQVEVRLSRIGEAVEIAVSDTGIGIEAEFLPLVFDRFRQADSTSTRQYGGLGLGLAIVRHLVELHGGTVAAESPGEGQGTTIRVRLPIVEGNQAREILQQQTPEAEVMMEGVDTADLQGIRVLVVDDEADARELLATILRQSGAEVKTADSAAMALTVLTEWQPNILVSDIGMPDEDGYELMRQVRTLTPERGGKIPAVALTAYARFEDRLRALSVGYQMHVAKPLDPAELTVVIRSLVTGKTAV